MHALNETSMKYWMFRLFDKAKALLNDCRRVYFCVNAILKRQALNMRISQLVPSLYPGDPSCYLGLALIYGRNVWLLKSEKDIPSSQHHHHHATHIQFYAKHLHMWSREIRIWVSCEISGKLKPARNTWLNSQKIGSGFYYFSNSTHFTSHYTWQTEQVFTLVIKRNVAFGLISSFINSNQNQWGGNW